MLFELFRRYVVLGDALRTRLCFLYVLTCLHVDGSDALAYIFLFQLPAKDLDLGELRHRLPPTAPTRLLVRGRASTERRPPRPARLPSSNVLHRRRTIRHSHRPRP